MTDFHVVRVAVGEITDHPNAERLEITQVGGYPVVIAKGSFKPGDDAIYVPEDSVVDTTRPEFSFLDKPRIRAKKLRNIFSMGLLVPTPEDVKHLGPDADYAAALGITKYIPPEEVDHGGDSAKPPAFGPKYTDIEPLRRWPNLIKEGEHVVLTEKLHGSSWRACYDDQGMHVGSHNQWVTEGENKWWAVARRYGLIEALSKHPGLVVFGEVYGQDASFGQIQGGFHYGTKNAHGFRIFDIFSIELGSYLSWPNVVDFVLNELPLCQTVPVLYEGPWYNGLIEEYGDGPTTLGGGHTREGFVVKPWIETFSPELNGRLILKYHGETYLMKKG